MNILFLAPRLPFPLDTGGKIRTFHMLKQAARFGRVHLVSFVFDPEDASHKSTFEEAGIEVSLVTADPLSFFKKVKGLFGEPLPFSIGKYQSAGFRKVLQDLLSQKQFDLAHVDHLHMAPYVSFLKETPLLLDEHNVEYRILERCALTEQSWGKKKIYSQQAAKTKIFEEEWIQKFSVVSAVSEEDAEVLRILGRGGARVEVLPNGVDTEYFNPPGGISPEQQDAVVFTGSMDWLPNDDAVRYFIEEILPVIWRQKPQLKFFVVGKSPSFTVLKAANKDSRVLVTGRVADVRDFLAKAKVFVVPLRIGGGTRLKILEAMSFGLPVVSTTIGAEGIACRDGENIAIADTPVLFAENVLKMLGDASRRNSVAEAGRRLVAEKYDWKIIGDKLGSIYKELSGGKK